MPASGEIAQSFVRREIEFGEDHSHLGIDLPATPDFDFMLEVSESLYIRIAVRMMRQLLKFLDETVEFLESFLDIFGHGQVVGGGETLLQHADANAGVNPHFPLIGKHLAADDAQQGRFPRAVAAEQADPFTLGDAEGDIFQYALIAEIQRYVIEAQQGIDLLMLFDVPVEVDPFQESTGVEA